MAPQTWSLVAKWAARTVSVLLLGLVMFAITVLIVIPRATHGTALTVLTGSMTPDIPVGSLVIDRPVDPGTLRVGDIATYQVAPGKAEYITHRIVKIDASKTPVAFTFKGDANRGPDIHPVPATAIRGKVWFHVPYLGAIRDAIHTKGGLAGIGMLLLAGYALVQFAGAIRDRRSSTATPAEEQVVDAAHFAPTSIDASDATVVAKLPIDAFEGLSPEHAAVLLRARLIHRDEETFVVALDDRVSRLDDTLALLKMFDAIDIDLQLPDGGSPAADRLPDELAQPEASWDLVRLDA